VKRLDDAGAVLVAKLTLGALAQGDVWYGERTRNPWNPATGSSGSSAGPASATAAGCVGFSIGSETNGSITSPARTCGVSGFRPTFGRVPRTGAMALSWTTDKLGPICRSAEDAALVFAAIQGPDGYDYSVKEYPFNWNASIKPSQLRIGYFKTSGQRNLFERRDAEGNTVPNAEALNFMKVLESLGAKVVEVEDPTPSSGFLDDLILHAEAGAAFQQPTLVSQLDVMMRGKTEFPSTWPDYFRAAQFYPATDYVNANRARTLLCQKWWDLFEKYDVIFSPAENTSVTNVVGTRRSSCRPASRFPSPSRAAAAPGAGRRWGWRGWQSRADTTRHGGTSTLRPAPVRSAPDVDVHHGPDLPGRESPRRRTRLPDGDRLPQEAPAAVLRRAADGWAMAAAGGRRPLKSGTGRSTRGFDRIVRRECVEALPPQSRAHRLASPHRSPSLGQIATSPIAGSYKSPTPPKKQFQASWCLMDVRGDETLCRGAGSRRTPRTLPSMNARPARSREASPAPAFRAIRRARGWATRSHRRASTAFTASPATSTRRSIRERRVGFAAVLFIAATGIAVLYSLERTSTAAGSASRYRCEASFQPS
jgi:hypothetical protein